MNFQYTGQYINYVDIVLQSMLLHSTWLCWIAFVAKLLWSEVWKFKVFLCTIAALAAAVEIISCVYMVKHRPFQLAGFRCVQCTSNKAKNVRTTYWLNTQLYIFHTQYIRYICVEYTQHWTINLSKQRSCLTSPATKILSLIAIQISSWKRLAKNYLDFMPPEALRW